MLIEIVLKDKPELEVEGYEKIKVGNSLVFANPVDKRVEMMLKNHPDGRVSIFTDKSEVVKTVEKSSGVVDVHPA